MDNQGFIIIRLSRKKRIPQVQHPARVVRDPNPVSALNEPIRKGTKLFINKCIIDLTNDDLDGISELEIYHSVVTIPRSYRDKLKMETFLSDVRFVEQTE